MLKDIINKNESVIPNGDKLALLKENFPSCFRADGTFDLANFSDFLKDKINVTKEGYGLNFLGKDYAKMLASLDTATIIQPDLAHSSKAENKDSENIYISGDNLDALKHLLKSYSGKVKCIYIDPPYNTGSDGFVYKDNFNFTSEYLQEKLDLDEKQAEHLLAFTKRQSASHSAWLMFMYPRLQLARDLLARDGVIFISIDDNEVANLKVLCNEIFGEENFVSQINILCNPKGRSQDKYLATNHDFCLVYSKTVLPKGCLSLEKEEEQIENEYPEEDDGGKYRLIELRNTHREYGRHNRRNLYYPIYVDPSDENTVSIKKSENSIAVLPIWDDGFEGCWTWKKAKAESDIDFLVAIKNEGNEKYKIYRKSYANGSERMLKTVLREKHYYTERGQKEFNSLFKTKSKIFQFPKAPELIKTFLAMSLSKSDIVVDFFSGSATTADALLRLNVENETNNRYILVQWPELCKENSIAYNAGFKTIDEIGRKRIELAAEKIREENPLFHGDLGFKHYTLVTPPQNTLDKMIEFNPEADDLIAIDEMLSALGGKDTVLTTWLVRDGYGFSSAGQAVELKNYTAWWCDKHLYLIAPGFSEEDVVELFKKYDSDGAFSPETVVLFGYSFSEWTINEMLDKNLRQLKDGSKQLKINLEVRY